MAVLENLWALHTEGLFDVIVALLAAPPLPGEARYVLERRPSEPSLLKPKAGIGSTNARGADVHAARRWSYGAPSPALSARAPCRKTNDGQAFSARHTTVATSYDRRRPA